MQTRRIGSLTVSVAGLGCNNFGHRCDEATTAEVVHAALEGGVTFFDTADVYSAGASETYLGAALGARRDDVVIATKFGNRFGPDPEHGGASPRWIAQAVEASLQRLGTDRIDLYQLHRPDPNVPIEDTLGALHQLVQDGKVREIGNSNFSGAQIAEAHDVATSKAMSPFVCAQNHWSLLFRDVETDTLPACRDRDIAMLPYFPLAAGVLTGKYRRNEALPQDARLTGAPPERRERFLNDRAFDVVERLSEFARGHGRSVGELALAWLAAQSGVASVIAGATKPKQVRANIEGASWVLTDAEVAEVSGIAS
jgi:aryl-alcohol dehydrogenase-like predicted oxidoreductase